MTDPKSEIRRLEARIADIQSLICEADENDDRMKRQIEAWENEIQGLKYSLENYKAQL